MNIDICLERLKKFVPSQIKDKLAILEDLLEEDKIEKVVSLQFIEHYFEKKEFQEFIKDKKMINAILLNLIKKLVKLNEFLPEVSCHSWFRPLSKGPPYTVSLLPKF